MVLETASLGLEIAAEIVVHAVEVGRPGGLAIPSEIRGRPDPATFMVPATIEPRAGSNPTLDEPPHGGDERSPDRAGSVDLIRESRDES